MTLQVEGTNDSSCLSKCSAAEWGYFNDEFLRLFVTKCPRRAPLIHLGYSVRAVIINCLVEEFAELNTNKKQIVSFGAGFDTLFFKLKKKNPHNNIVYYELDLPRVVKRKICCIQRSQVLSDIIGEWVESQDGLLSNHYKLLATDLRDINAVEELFQTHGLDQNIPTLFLSECAVTYLEEGRSSDLIEFVSKFQHATFVTYEQIHPDDGFGHVMLHHFATLQSPLMSVAKYPTLEHQTQRYIDHKWQHCTSISALEAYNQILSVEERSFALRLEPFDEWEEFYLKCVHYALIIASNGSLSNWSKLCHKPAVVNGIPLRRQLVWELKESMFLARYGHSVVNNSDKLVLVGGFGVRSDNSHGRMNEIIWLKETDSNLVNCEGVNTATFSSMYTSWTPVADGSYIVYGGRTSPMCCVSAVPELVTLPTDQYEDITRTPLVICCERPARWRHSAVLAKINGIDTFVVFGGRTSDLELLNDAWMVPLQGEREVTVLSQTEQQPSPRFSHSAAVRHRHLGSDEVWVSGGMGENAPLGDVWCLDLETLLWRPLAVSGMLTRFGHTSSMLMDSLVMVGGVNGLDCAQPGVAVLDLITGSCVEYQLPMTSPERGMLLINHCHVISKDKKALWIIGGGGNCFSFGTFFNKRFAIILLKDLGLE